MTSRLHECGRFHHVGVAVDDLDAATAAYAESCGATVDGETFDDPLQQVRIRFLSLGGARIELLAPMSDKSHLSRILNRGIGVYHICYEVPNLDQTLADMQSGGAKIIAPAKPAVAFGGRRVAFTMQRGLMIELLEA